MCAVEIHQMVRTARTVFDAKKMPSARSKMAPRQTMGHASVVAGRAKHAPHKNHSANLISARNLALVLSLMGLSQTRLTVAVMAKRATMPTGATATKVAVRGMQNAKSIRGVLRKNKTA